MYGDIPRIELFAREKREGFDVWGTETEKFEDKSQCTQTLLPLAEQQKGGNGIPPTNKLVGILPKRL